MSTYSNKNKVLVAGATGLIGSNLVNQLVEEGYDVRGTLHDNEPSMPNPSVEYVKADLTSLDRVTSLRYKRKRQRLISNLGITSWTLSSRKNLSSMASLIIDLRIRDNKRRIRRAPSLRAKPPIFKSEP